MPDEPTSPVTSAARVHLALFTVSMIFGINSVTSKIALAEIDPMALVVIRIVTAAVLLLVLHRLLVGERIRGIGDYLRLAWYSIFGIVINQMLFLKGLSMTTVINATVLVTAIPVVTILIAILLRREPPSLRRIAGSVLSFAGIVVLLGSEHMDFQNRFFVGNVLVFLNAVSFSVYLVISKPILDRYRPATVVTWNFVFGALGVIPFGWQQVLETPFARISLTAWACVAFLILFASVLVYYINGWALQKTTSSTVAAYIYVQPLMATLISVAFLHESLTIGTLFAAGLIFSGVFLVSFTRGAKDGAGMDLIRESAALKEE